VPKCTEPNCTEEAVYYVWFTGYGGLYTYRYKDHLIWNLQTSPFEICQVNLITVPVAAALGEQLDD
jgi:hypothetical protein